MKICTNCGSQSPDHFTQCPNCGAQMVQGMPQPAQTASYIPPAYQQEPTTTFWGWIGWLLLSLIPFVGVIIAMTTAKDPSVRNYAKASLIMYAVAFVLGIVRLVAGGLFSYAVNR